MPHTLYFMIVLFFSLEPRRFIWIIEVDFSTWNKIVSKECRYHKVKMCQAVILVVGAMKDVNFRYFWRFRKAKVLDRISLNCIIIWGLMLSLTKRVYIKYFFQPKNVCNYFQLIAHIIDILDISTRVFEITFLHAMKRFTSTLC